MRSNIEKSFNRRECLTLQGLELFHPARLQLVLVAVPSLFAEVSMVALQHFTEHFVVFRNKQVILRLYMTDDFGGQRLRLSQIRCPTIETRALNGTRRDIQNAIARTSLLQFDIDTLDENLQSSLCGSIEREERRGHETSHHNRSRRSTTGDRRNA